MDYVKLTSAIQIMANLPNSVRLSKTHRGPISMAQFSRLTHQQRANLAKVVVKLSQPIETPVVS